VNPHRTPTFLPVGDPANCGAPRTRTGSGRPRSQPPVPAQPWAGVDAADAQRVIQHPSISIPGSPGDRGLGARRLGQALGLADLLGGRSAGPAAEHPRALASSMSSRCRSRMKDRSSWAAAPQVEPNVANGSSPTGAEDQPWLFDTTGGGASGPSRRRRPRGHSSGAAEASGDPGRGHAGPLRCVQAGASSSGRPCISTGVPTFVTSCHDSDTGRSWLIRC